MWRAFWPATSSFSTALVRRDEATLLLDGEYPDDAALRDVVVNPDIVLGQCVLDTLSVDTPARLDRDIFRAIHFIGDWHGHDAGVGLLLPEDFTRLGIEGAEIAVVGSSGENQIAGGRGHRPEQL